MIYDAIERMAAMLQANFAADLAALAVAKNEPAIDQTLSLYKRQDAEAFYRYNAAGRFDLPGGASGLGLYPRRAVTQARYQGTRYSKIDLVFDYYCRGTDPVVLAKQTELVAEAILRSLDRVAGTGAGVYGAAELENSTTVDFPIPNFADAPEGTYQARVVIVSPIHDSDTIT